MQVHIVLHYSPYGASPAPFKGVLKYLMVFMGEVVHGTTIEKHWLATRRTGYELDGVRFHLHKGHFYTDPLSEDEIERMDRHPMVRLTTEGSVIELDKSLPVIVEETPDEEPQAPRKPGRPKKVR